MIRVSYIIISWNGIGHLRRLFGSLSGQMSRVDVEVLLVDNGSTDGTKEYVERELSGVRYIGLSENRGVAYARNRALEVARGRYLFILDNDIIASDEALDGMLCYMEKHTDIGLMGCRLLYEDGVVQLSYKPYPSLLEKIRNVINPRRRDDYYEKSASSGEVFEPEYVIGACQLIRRDVYERVGGLDEQIFYGPEDCDYCIRVREAGYRVVYNPSWSMIHCCQRRTSSHPFSPLGRKHIRGLIYFYRKHGRI